MNESYELVLQPGRRVVDLDLRGIDLTARDLGGLGADRIDLRRAVMCGAVLSGARFSHCRFEHATLDDLDASSATFRDCALDTAHAVGARFDGARLEDSTAAGADFTRASFRGAHLTETSFARAVLCGAALDDAEGEGVDLRGADLRGVTLARARFSEADFRGADLRGAELTGGSFRGADFRGALVDEVCFDHADCLGARFDEGAGPRAAAGLGRRPAAARSFDDVALTALRELITQLPAALSSGADGPAAFSGSVQQALATLNSAASGDAAQWNSWAGRIAKMTSGKEPADLQSIIAALGDAPIGRSTDGTTIVADALGPLQSAVEALAAAGGQPPEEWKPCLEALMKMTSGDLPLDLKALLDQLAAVARRSPNSPPPGV